MQSPDPDSLDEPDLDFAISAMDLMSAVIEGLCETAESLVVSTDTVSLIRHAVGVRARPRVYFAALSSSLPVGAMTNPFVPHLRINRARPRRCGEAHLPCSAIFPVCAGA